SVQALAIPHGGNGRFGTVTVSVGVAVARPSPVELVGADSLALRADLALYAAKNAGRNRVTAADALVQEDDIAWHGDE
ncbi:GGDEF domain-containing protein, partial [Mycobacterium tuberculosis]|nr:GGDEF domain-containing protein [Mycobacterium tuberculosis]